MSLRLAANLFSRCIKINTFQPQVTAARGYENWRRGYFEELFKRRIEQGPEPERPASAWINWNYDSEIFCFGKRLGEDFKEETLKKAFVNPSYAQKELQSREEHGLEGNINIENNLQLAEEGSNIIKQVLEKFLRSTFSHLSEEGIQTLVEYLNSDATISYVSSNLGVRDLVLCAEFPPSEETMSRSFRAVIGALYKDQGYEKVEKFIKDFIAVQLIGKKLDEIWDVPDPMSLLCKEYSNRGLAEPEARLMWASATETIFANYIVGIYSNKKLIGQGPGESIAIAQHMASKDALRNLYQIQDKRNPMKF